MTKIPQSNWGRDHVSTLLYIETRCVDHRGVPKMEHMRADGRIHPTYAHGNRPAPTRLRNGEELLCHDDWSIVEEFEAAGIVENTGTGVNVRWRLTDKGWEIVHKLRRARAERYKTSEMVEALHEALP